VDVELVGDVGPGDNVLVHAGVALARLAEGAFA
jgi:hydrogenase maturation factor